MAQDRNPASADSGRANVPKGVRFAAASLLAQISRCQLAQDRNPLARIPGSAGWIVVEVRNEPAAIRLDGRKVGEVTFHKYQAAVARS